MLQSFSLDDFPLPPPPPSFLYKYLVADRVSDVLDAGMVRFTQLLHTNDSFEVRTTFRKFAGPRFVSMLERYVTEKMDDEYVNERLRANLAERGMHNVSVEDVKRQMQAVHGTTALDYMRVEMKTFIKSFTDSLNSSDMAEATLHQLGSELLCFSLSERYDSNPMWAHYAGNHTGFAIAFDTSHPWFLGRKGAAKSRLQKVSYLDGLLDEPFEDPQAAFISKTSDWSYEREWRLYCGLEDVEKTVGSDPDPVNLLSFPREAVHSVIAGQRASEETIEKIKRSCSNYYPKAQLFRAFPRRDTQTFDLQRL